MDDVLSSYQYDSFDRLTAVYLGEEGSGIKVTDYYYSDSTWGIEGGLSVRRDYVDQTHYRATVYLSDSYGSPIAERYYDDLQVGQTIQGPYGTMSDKFTKQSVEIDSYHSIDILKKKITQLPRGNKIAYWYDEGSGITRIEKVGLDPCNVVVQEINEYDGLHRTPYRTIDRRNLTTEYDYDIWWNNNVENTSTDASISNFSSATAKSTAYKYDGFGRLTAKYERVSDSSFLTTAYSYDSRDNLVTRIDGYNTNGAQTTVYEYNIYNEQTLVQNPDGLVTRTHYDEVGRVTCRSEHNGTATDALSATSYSYDSNGWLETTGTVKADEPFSLSSGQLNWVNQVNLYDAYGRKTAVIDDAGGKDLTTSYEYNYQSEVTKLTYPDSRFKITERDGQGRTIREITGINGTSKATTSFTYDANGNLTKKTDPEGVSEVYTYDEFDQLVRVRRGK